MKTQNTTFDVAILGSGIAGSTLAAILSKKGLSTVLIDRSSHPRFALGESTIGETSFLLRLLSVRYGIPELGHVSSSKCISDMVSKRCGIKRNFGFVYQREGKEHDSFEVTQCNVSEGPFGPESHLMRADVDEYLFKAAVKYGATPLEDTIIDKVLIDDEKGATLILSDGKEINAQYVVDATGQHSILANQFGLREMPCRFNTQSRTIFTHMKGVKPYDDVDEPSGQPTKWHEGTLHHLFDGGWMWVIPFDNHSESESDLVSIGLNLDCNKYPYQKDRPASDEWTDFLSRFPTIARQFENAETVFPWVSTNRTQYSSSKTVGNRWMLMSHAAGAIDALFSRGLSNTMAVIEAFVPQFLEAFAEKDFSAERFEYIDRLSQNLLNNNDKLIAGSYISFRDFDLWRAWSKVWFFVWNLGVMRYSGIYYRYLETGDSSLFDMLHTTNSPGMFCPELKAAQKQFEDCFALMKRVENDELSIADAVIELASTLGDGPASPAPLRLHDVLRRWHDGSEEAQKTMYEWGQKESPLEVRHYFNFDRLTIKHAADSLSNTYA